MAFHHTLAHDLRGPLTVINGYAEMLREALREETACDDIAQLFEGILEGTGKLGKMIEDLVDNARIEGGQCHLEPTPVDLQVFLGSLAESFQIAGHSKRLVSRIPQNLPAVSADPARLERIFTNLIGNALKFSPVESQVLVQARQADGEVLVSIADRGQGIAAEDCSHLFKRFFQVEGSQAGGGVGLGLYITRLLVEAHGGRIWVVSKLGEGSNFHFTLQIHKEDYSIPRS